MVVKERIKLIPRYMILFTKLQNHLIGKITAHTQYK